MLAVTKIARIDKANVKFRVIRESTESKEFQKKNIIKEK
jgi:hypothetical protein